MLDCLWIESRIENVANRGFCLSVVTAMGAVVHCPGLSGDWLTKGKSSWFGVVNALAYPVIGWTWQRAAALGWSPDVAVCTTLGTAVYWHWLSGATTAF